MLLIRPVVTEKTLQMVEKANTYAFEVAVGASKNAAASELEQAFNVKVTNVRSHTRPGKAVFFGRRAGTRSARKIMYFTLKGDQKIDLFTR